MMHSAKSLSPFQGERLGEGVFIPQYAKKVTHCAFQIIQNIIILNPNDPISLMRKIVIAAAIIIQPFTMTFSIDFNDQAMLHTQKIYNKRPYGDLSSKLETAKTTRTQHRPYDPLNG